VHRDVLDGGGGRRGGDRGGVDDANVGEDLPRQPPPVEVVHFQREAVGHGEGGRGSRMKWGRWGLGGGGSPRRRAGLHL
jgi:hypothetical protein